MTIERCNLFDGQPYMGEKDSKYHVLQGSLEADDVQMWYDTEEEAIWHWNSRVAAVQKYDKSRMGIDRDIKADYELMSGIMRDMEIDLNPQIVKIYDEDGKPRYVFEGYEPTIAENQGRN